MKIHFIGIGGIGISGLAQFFLKKGHKVSGSDLVSSEITKLLKKKGAKVLIGKHNSKNLPKDTDKVIYSQAIKENNPELKKAKERGIKTQSYPQALGEITKRYFTIAVAGTHGKSTTASMIALILIKAGLDPTLFLGTKLKELNSNFRMGKSKYLVIEADEWKASFLNYFPKIIVLTNIEEEHLDYYKNLKSILKAYQDFIKKLPEKGLLIANQDDKNIRTLLKKGFLSKPFTLKQKETKKLKEILKIPGQHNIYNSLAALTTARSLKIPDEVTFKTLSKFRGAWRRFEIIRGGRATFISDYAHHPTEIKATLKAAREKFPKKKIWIVFQPHQILRTYYFFNEFVEVFSNASFEKLIITDIYQVAGRDQEEKVSSRKLVKEIKKSNKDAIYIPNIQKIASFLKQNLKGEKVIVVMGAGNIYKLINKVIRENREKVIHN